MSNEKKPHLSYSQLNLFANCGEAYRRRYVEGEIIPPGIAAIRGSGVHGGAEVNHRQKIESGKDLSIAKIKEAAVSAFEERKARDGFVLTPEEMQIGVAKVVGGAKDATARLAELYAKKVAPGIQPKAAELSILINVPNSGEDLLAILDVVTVDSRVPDLKTADRSKRQSDADESLQLTFYALAHRALYGHDPKELSLEVLVDKKEPEHQSLTTLRGQQDYEVLMARIRVMQRAKQAGIFTPANVGHWLCNAKYCGFWFSCKYVNAERRAATEKTLQTT